MIGVDCSQRVSGAALAAMGRQFCFRYISSYPLPKDLQASEIADLHTHGIHVGLVMEDGNYSVTPAQAEAAVERAQALGAPKGTAIFMACDENPAPTTAFYDMSQSSVILRNAGYLAGWYGNKDTARNLQGNGIIDGAWVVDTWGADTASDRWNFRQLPNSPNLAIGGVDCDQDDAPFPVGLWAPPAPAPSKETPVYQPPLILEPIVDAVSCPGGARLLAASGAVYTFPLTAPGLKGVNGQPFFAGRTAARFDAPNQAEQAAGKVLVIEDPAGERYALPF